MSSKPRKIHDKQDARLCLRAAEHAGLSLATGRAPTASMLGRSISGASISIDVTTSGARPTLVELVPMQSNLSAARSPADGGARYFIDLDDVRLEFGRDADPARLSRVLEVLRAC